MPCPPMTSGRAAKPGPVCSPSATNAIGWDIHMANWLHRRRRIHRPHVLRELQASGRGVVVVDDLSTGFAERVPAGVPLIEAKVSDRDAMSAELRDNDITGVIHLAAKKAVGESVQRPLSLPRNVEGIVSLLDAMNEVGVNNIVYSSSAAVYGEPLVGEVSETEATVPTSPYGETKLIGEWTVRAVATSRRLAGGVCPTSVRGTSNVAGAGSDELGDTSVANLIPLALRAITNDRPPQIFGDDYPTPDGTCIRDYIHVVDLARSHVAAAQLCEEDAAGERSEIFNVGRGHGSSVRDVLNVVADISGRGREPEVTARRPGDPRSSSPAQKINSELGWASRNSTSPTWWRRRGPWPFVEKLRD